MNFLKFLQEIESLAYANFLVIWGLTIEFYPIKDHFNFVMIQFIVINYE